jgi:uncharacterized protein (AIM24 family)
MKLEVHGAVAAYVDVELSAGEQLLAEPGSLLCKEPGVVMRPALEGGLGGALKRAFAGSSLVLVTYEGPGLLSLTKGAPGRVLSLVLDGGRAIHINHHAFLCAERSVSLDATSPSSGGLLWARLPLVMLRLGGAGRALVFARGDAKEVHLGRGESLDVAPGRVVWLDGALKVERAPSPGLKATLLGGMGVALARLTGPGTVCLQTRDAEQLRILVEKERRRPRPSSPDDVPENWIWEGHRGE